MSPHVRFTAASTAYLRRLDDEIRHGEAFAVRYQRPPVHNAETGATSIGMRFPMLIVTDYYEQPREIAERIAHILNEHWDDEVPA